jgi:ribosomal protein S18 acetylase RimI-like enzyme
MDIRIATSADRGAVTALWEAAQLTRPWNPPDEDFERALTGASSTILVGFDDAGELVATAMVGDDGHRGWIYYVAVPVERQRLGLGAEIVAAAEDWLRERGCRKVELMVRDDNDDVVGFYEALGYVPDAVRVLGRWL